MGKHTMDRRNFVKTMGALAGATAVAGCNSSSGESSNGTGDSSDKNLGERVPSMACPYWSDVGRASTCEEQLATQNDPDEIGRIRVCPECGTEWKEVG